MRRDIKSVIFVLLVARHALAAPLPGGLTPHEHHAAYCMGALGVSIESMRAAMAAPPMTVEAMFDQAQRTGSAEVGNTEELLSWARSAAARRRTEQAALRTRLRDAEARVRGFADSIDRNGTMVDLDRTQAPPALSAAMKQGAADATQCDATTLHCVFLYSPRFDAAQSGGQGKLADCVGQEASCARAQACQPPG
jgi:hypothetical protein